MTENKWIKYVNQRESKSGRTKEWDVVIAQGGNEGVQLGVIKWYGAWHQYAFFPFESTLYEQDCLRDIAAFLDEQKRIRAADRSWAAEQRRMGDML